MGADEESWNPTFTQNCPGHEPRGLCLVPRAPTPSLQHSRKKSYARGLSHLPSIAMRSPGAILLLVIALLVGFAGCAGCSTYNSLVSADEQVERAWNDVESQYQRRADLIPNLVNVVRGQAGFEQETLEGVVNARARATSISLSADDLRDPAALERFQQAQSELGNTDRKSVV